MTADEHALGAQAARQLGRVAAALDRLARAEARTGDPALGERIQDLRRRFGPVRIAGTWRRPPRLARDGLPFAADERKALAHAQATFQASGRFEGYLPAGDHLPGDRPLTVVPGGTVQAVEARRPGQPGAAPSEQVEALGAGYPDTASVLVYAGAMVEVGPGLSVSSQPTPAGGQAVAPPSLTLGAVALRLGAELGFTPRVSLVPSVGWTGAWGAQHGVHQIQGALEVAWRNGRFRGSLGPAFGVALQRGYGVADTLDRDQDGDPRPTSQLQYTGEAFGPGATLGLGVTAFTMGALDGQVALRGEVQLGDRTYGGVSLGLRLVSRVPSLGVR